MTFVGTLMFDTVRTEKYISTHRSTYNVSFSNKLNITQFEDFTEKPSISCFANISLSWNFNESSAAFLLESDECGLFTRSSLEFADDVRDA